MAAVASTNESYAPGQVIVAYLAPGKRGKKIKSWRLHRDDCVYVVGPWPDGTPITKTLPAPARPYPNTTDCKVCKPTAQHRPTRTFNDDTQMYVYACSCGIRAERITSAAARHACRREHERLHLQESVGAA